MTRYGTVVNLCGGIDVTSAKKMKIAPAILKGFGRGFPVKWKSLLKKWIESLVMDDKGVGSLKGKQKIRKRPRKIKSGRKRGGSVAREEPADDSKEVRCETYDGNGIKSSSTASGAKPGEIIQNDKASRRRQKKDKNGRKRVGFRLPGEEDDVEEHASAHASPRWSREQQQAFDNARNTIPADAPGYWDLVADRVEGKSAEDCCHRWESQWDTPKRKSAPSVAVDQTTPEIANQMLNGKINTKSGKYRTNMRRIIAAESRDRDDNDFEPPEAAEINLQPLATPQTPSLAHGTSLSNALKMGTPGTEVRAARAAIDRAGSSKTPEVLMRGRSWGMAEADQYAALFKRRLGLSEKMSKATIAKRKTTGNRRGKKISRVAGTPKLGKSGRGRFTAINDIPQIDAEDDSKSDSDSDSDEEFEVFF